MRPTFASFLWVIGGFLALITRLTNFGLANYQSFTIDKSLIKKIFSFKRDTDPATMNKKFHMLDQASDAREKKQGQLTQTLKSREVFRYTWT